MAKAGYSTNLGLGPLPEFSQANSPDIFADGVRVRNALRVLQAALDEKTGEISPSDFSTGGTLGVTIQNYTKVYAKATDNMVRGHIVTLYSSGGVLSARKAYASVPGHRAMAFCNTDVAAGQYAEFILEGMCYYVGPLVIGATYYLANATSPPVDAGLISSVAGGIPQRLGFALGNQALYFRPDLI